MSLRPSTHEEAILPEDVVCGVYRALLMRAPDPTGLEHAVNQLRATGSVDDVLIGILQSVEFRERLPQLFAHHQAAPSVEAVAAFHREAAPDLSDPFRLDQTIRNHPAWRDSGVLAEMAYPVAMLIKPIVFDLDDPDAIAKLKARNIDIHADEGSRSNKVVLDDDLSNPAKVDIHFSNGSNNLIVIGPQCWLLGHISFHGSGNLCYCSGKGGDVQVYSTFFYGLGCAFVFGLGSTCVNGSFHIEGPNRHLVVGRDCMLSSDVYVALTDNHAILDVETQTVLNLPGDLRIGPHAWIGLGTTILKDAHVGAGAIVAARATVTRPVEPQTIVAGAPARVIRRGVDWSRHLPSEMAVLRNSVGEALTSQFVGLRNPIG